MKIQLNTDSNIQGDEALATHVEGVIKDALDRFSTQVTRVEVHLSDLNASKGGDADKHCLIEARLEGLQPVVVTHDADTVRAAISGATRKLLRLLESTLGKLAASERQSRPTVAGDEEFAADPTSDSV